MSDNILTIDPAVHTPPPRPEPARMVAEGVEIVDSAEDVNYDELAPKQLTAAMLNVFADEHPEAAYPTFPLHLPRTSMKLGSPFMAQVRIINLTDRTVLDIVPQEIRKLVQRLFFAASPNQQGRNKGTPESRMNEQLKRVKEIAYAYGVAGFVQPRLVLNAADIKDAEQEAWVGTIDLGDLTEFVRICEGDEQLAARRLEGFSFG